MFRSLFKRLHILVGSCVLLLVLLLPLSACTQSASVQSASAQTTTGTLTVERVSTRGGQDPDIGQKLAACLGSKLLGTLVKIGGKLFKFLGYTYTGGNAISVVVQDVNTHKKENIALHFGWSLIPYSSCVDILRELEFEQTAY